jgi:serine/threonine protein kinase
VIRITLLNTLLGDKYCIHKLLKNDDKCWTYLSINIQNGYQYVVKFYRLDEISDDDEMCKIKELIHQRVRKLHCIQSPNVVKCYEIYEDESYIAVVYEYIPKQYEKEVQSLINEVEHGNHCKEDFTIISKHIFHGMDALRKVGIAVNKVRMENIFYKNGYYKIDFPLSFNAINEEEESEIVSNISNISQPYSKTDDVSIFGILCLKFILGTKYN